MSTEEIEAVNVEYQERQLTEGEHRLIESDTLKFDNEWVKYMCQLAENKSIGDIVDYINSVSWTDRQKKTIMSYSRIVLGNGLSTTYFINNLDYRMLYDDKALIDCDLMLGMTRFDVTPELNILLGLINLHFGVESRKSKGGMFLKRIGAQRHEIVQEERNRDKDIGFKEKVASKLGFGD
jgi:hypothetical protein